MNSSLHRDIKDYGTGALQSPAEMTPMGFRYPLSLNPQILFTFLQRSSPELHLVAVSLKIPLI